MPDVKDERYFVFTLADYRTQSLGLFFVELHRAAIRKHLHVAKEKIRLFGNHVAAARTSTAEDTAPWYPESDCFSGDAWRVAMNLSLDYALFRGHECEKNICERLLFFFESRRPYLADYAIDGGNFPRPGRNATPGVIAMNAAATQVLPEGDPLIKPFAKDLAALSVPYRFWRYYDGMLYLIGLLATAGKIRF